jgi:hypothetical protein
MKRGPYRDGRVHVLAEMCGTCIFRPGNLMDLRRGRVAQMVRDAKRNESCIPCHDTLDGRERAVCRGFYDLHATAPLQTAARLDLIAFDTPQKKCLIRDQTHCTLLSMATKSAQGGATKKKTMAKAAGGGAKNVKNAVAKKQTRATSSASKTPTKKRASTKKRAQ